MSSTTNEDGSYKLPGYSYDLDGIPSQGYYNPDLTNEDDPASVMMMTAPEHNVVVVGVLIALIIILCLILGCVTIPPIIALIQRQLPVPQARIDRRFATIDGWLITKVRKFESRRDCIVPTSENQILTLTTDLPIYLPTFLYRLRKSNPTMRFVSAFDSIIASKSRCRHLRTRQTECASQHYRVVLVVTLAVVAVSTFCHRGGWSTTPNHPPKHHRDQSELK
jgi:hypothetical protein